MSDKESIHISIHCPTIEQFYDIPTTFVTAVLASGSVLHFYSEEALSTFISKLEDARQSAHRHESPAE